MKAFARWLNECSSTSGWAVIVVLGITDILPGIRVPFVDGRYSSPEMTWNVYNAAFGLVLLCFGVFFIWRNYRREMGGSGRKAGI